MPAKQLAFLQLKEEQRYRDAWSSIIQISSFKAYEISLYVFLFINILNDNGVMWDIFLIKKNRLITDKNKIKISQKESFYNYLKKKTH